jgi:hypothetical protein
MTYPAQVLGHFTFFPLTFKLPCSRSIRIPFEKREEREGKKKNRGRGIKG